MRATIKDVARLAGVSTATVSNVLTNKKYVSKELVMKINNAMQELDYKPNTIARGLKINKSFSIGLMVPDINNPFFSELAKYIGRVADEKNYQMILCSTDENTIKEKKILDSFLAAGMDGIINVAPRMKDKQLNIYSPVPMVIVDRPHFTTTENIGFVYADNYKGASDVADEFVRKGYKKFICLAGPVKEAPNARKRLQGFQDKLRELGVSDENLEIYYCDFTFDSGYSVMSGILEGYDPSDKKAVFVSNDMAAWGAIEAAKTKRIKIPRDIAFIGYDNIFFAKYIYPGLTTVENSTKDLGMIAAQLLMDSLDNNKSLKGSVVVVNSKLIERQSC